MEDVKMSLIKKILASTVVVAALASASSAFACSLKIDDKHTIRIQAHAEQEIGIYRGKTRIFHDPIRDGTHLSCGSSKLIPLDHRTGFSQYYGNIYQTTAGDVQVNGNILAVRHGKNRDLMRFYILHRNTQNDIVKVSAYSWVHRDGEHYGLASSKGKPEFIVKYGGDKDLFTRFCLKKGQLWRSPGNARGLGYAPACSELAEVLRFREAGV
jgi:hypothetical protein